MRRLRLSCSALMFLAILATGSALSQSMSDDQLRIKAEKLSKQFIIADTHIDVPYRIHGHWEDISQRTEKGEFDYVRAMQGGLNAPFMSIYVPAERENNGAKLYADTLIDMVNNFATRWPDKFMIAQSTADVNAQFKLGKISLCLGMENGSPVEGKLENVKYFYGRGIRYITLTHGKDNHIGDSSYDTTHTWHGLSPFGKSLVAEMNRVGIMVDISHVSDDTFFQVMQIAKAPAIASHSSCRFYTPGFERNMSDEMIQLLAKNGGTIQINFGSDFLREDIRKQEDAQRKEINKYFQANNLKSSDTTAQAYARQYMKEHPVDFADVKDVAENINHVVKLVGIDHVGIGSDFDGVGDSLPTGLKDVSQYPNLIYELLKLGYSDSDIQKICGGNLLRVWGQVEKVARELQGKK